MTERDRIRHALSKTYNGGLYREVKRRVGLDVYGRSEGSSSSSSSSSESSSSSSSSNGGGGGNQHAGQHSDGWTSHLHLPQSETMHPAVPKV